MIAPTRRLCLLALDARPANLTAALVSEYLEIKARRLL